MCCTTHIIPIDHLLWGLKFAMETKGCGPNNIQTFALGGQISNLEQERQILQNTELPLNGAIFNLTEKDESLSVTLTKNGIVWSKHQSPCPPPIPKETGSDLSEYLNSIEDFRPEDL